MADRDLTEDDVWGDDGGGADREEGEEQAAAEAAAQRGHPLSRRVPRPAHLPPPY